MIHRIQRKKRQVILTTHSYDLLSSKEIGGEEVLLMTPTSEGTRVATASNINDIKQLLEVGLSVADAALPYTNPPKIDQLTLF